MSTPSILYENLLKEAQDGRGDGTVYATGTGATVDQDNKTFTLAGLSIITDLGADANDKFNGYQLYFTTSERSYLITDWTAAGDVATTYEWPNVEDTGACEIRRTLYTNDFNVANPARFACNGQLEKKWTDNAADSIVKIFACAPNLIDDGGFELNSLTDYWTARGVAGTATVAVNAGTPILGTYDCKFNQGDQAYVGIEQAGKGSLRAGYTYGVILKAGGDAGAVTDFRVSFEYVAADATLVPVTFTEINSADDTATANIWKPAIADANAWDEITFTVSEDIDAGDWKLVLDQYDATDVFIDQIHIWEIGQTPPEGGLPNPDVLIIAGHNHAGGYASPSDISAHRVHDDLTGYVAGDDREAVLDLDADVTVPGNTTVRETWTATTAIYPIYGLRIDAIAAKIWEAAEIWIGKEWTWDQFISGEWLPLDMDIQVSAAVSPSGIKRVSEKYQQKLRAGDISKIDNDELARWKNFRDAVGLSQPFWYYMAALSDHGLDAEIILMRNVTKPQTPMNTDRIYSAQYEFEEVL